MQDPLNMGDLLKRNPLFLDFDGDDVALLARNSHAVRMSRHDFAFRRGDHADSFYVMVVGAIKLVLSEAHGQCRVIEFFEPGEHFGEPFVSLNHPYAASAQAMEGSLLVWIGKHAIDDALHVYPRLARQMLTGLSARLHTLMCDIGTVNLQSTSEWLIGYLLSLPRKFDRTWFPCNKSLVASRLELAPVTLPRTLRQLIRDGLIRVEGRGIVIQNTAALRRQPMVGQQQKLGAGQSPTMSD